MDSIVWRFSVHPGHDFCRLYARRGEWYLEGVAVFSHEGSPCVLNYHVVCDEGWRTQAAVVEGWVGQSEVKMHIRVDGDQRWWLDEIALPQVKGCTDIDLNFSPSTNTIAIRRLDLAVGERAEVSAAWLKFPSLEFEPLSQRYLRLDERHYRYESGGERFSADLRVNRAGLVVDYPGAWTAEAASER